MPTYQYACTTCGERLEVQQSFTDAALTKCPACEGRLRKVFSAVGVVFKGSGFYKTDSRAPEKAAEKSSDKSGESGGAGKAGAGDDKTGPAKTESTASSNGAGSPEKSNKSPATSAAKSTATSRKSSANSRHLS